MFVGHYGVSFALKTVDRRIPLWQLFVAVQLLDIIWAPLVLLGIERVQITPGITASNPLDLYYMPYTHSLVAALLWSLVAFLAYWVWRRAAPRLGGRPRRPAHRCRRVLALGARLRCPPARSPAL